MQKKVIVINLGTSAAGPRLALNLAKTLHDSDCLSGLVFSSNSTLMRDLSEVTNNFLCVDTYSSKLSFVNRVLHVKKLHREIAAYLDLIQPEIVMLPMQHALDPFLLPFLRKKRIRNGDRYQIVAWVHDGTTHPGDSKILGRFMMRSTLSAADSIVVLSENVLNIVSRRTKTRILRIEHPIVVEAQRKPFERVVTLSPKILFIGRIVQYKGITRLASSWPYIIEHFPNAELIVAGHGDVKLALDAFEGLPNVEMRIGYLEEGQMSEIISNSDLLVLPYNAASQSGVLIQAIEFGKPYVITPVSGLIEQARKLGGGVIAEDMSAPSFALAVCNALSGKDLIPLSMNLSFGWTSQIALLLEALVQRVVE